MFHALFRPIHVKTNLLKLAGVRWRAVDLLAHDPLKLPQAQPALVVAQPPVERDAEEVGVGHVQLGLEGLRHNHVRVIGQAPRPAGEAGRADADTGILGEWLL